MNQNYRILTSKIKEGDVFQCGSNTRQAFSDAYLCKDNGCWSVDISKDHRYSWEQTDIMLVVSRKYKN